MSDLVARTGRHQQRYEGGCRLVAGCIPFKYRDCDDTFDAKPDKTVEVLMINSQSGPGLLFPKGGWENDETVEEAAVREALEEAGVRGDLMEQSLLNKWPQNPAPIIPGRNQSIVEQINDNLHPFSQYYPGSGMPEEGWISVVEGFLGYYYFKSKSHQDEFSPEGLCKASMFAMHVKEELCSWPEQSTRERRWLTVPEAADQCRHPWMQKALLEGFSKWHADSVRYNPEEDQAR